MGKKTPGFIDTHAHLTFPEYDKDRKDVLKRAWDAGLEAIVTIGAGRGLEGNKDAVEFAEKNKNVYATVGIHPHDAESVNIDQVVSELKKLAKSKKVVAVGEIGLDYYKNKSSVEAQRRCFYRLVSLAHDLGLPISIHDRDAHKDILYILRECQDKLNGGIFHCFSGDADMAMEVVRMGFYVAIPGVVTFKKSDVLKKVVSEVPLERIVLETDCPFLSPEPYRGKRNEPAYLVHTAEEIAKITRLSIADIARITTLNAQRALNLPGLIPTGKIAYAIRKSLYLNLTNRCNLGCKFCPKRSGNFEVKGHNLKLTKEPDIEDIFRAIGGLRGYDEVVFCGFGEPTLRLELLKVIAKKVKESGVRVRIDTDGLMNLVYERDVLPELKGLVDSVSVSMNAHDPKTYNEICPSKFGDKAFYAMISFLEKAKNYIPDVSATVVGMPGINVEACKKLAAGMGVLFRLRKYQDLG